MNLKESKQSNYLVGIYLDKLEKENNLASCLHSLANQTLPVDVVLFAKGLTAEEILFCFSGILSHGAGEFD
jgi:hypothetical protein